MAKLRGAARASANPSGEDNDDDDDDDEDEDARLGPETTEAYVRGRDVPW